MAKQLDQIRSDLHSSNADHRVAAVRQLAEQRVWEALEEVVRLLEVDECGFSVAQALTGYGPEICKRTELEYTLFHPKKEVCYRAAWVLGFFGDQRAVKPLMDALKEPFFHDHFLPMLKRLGVPDLERQIEQHQHEEVQDQNGTGVDDDLDGEQKFGIEEHEEAGHMQEQRQQGQAAMDRARSFSSCASRITPLRP